MNKVSVERKRIVIPTYEIKEYDKNPMFLEKRVYQGSSGRVYPHPICEGVADEKTDKEYDAIFLENDYILVMLLPELGGRVQRLYDKTNGYDAVYYNEVIKPALVGLAGPWISGGIEFNWPQHHRPSTYDPVSARITEHEDGSVSVVTGEIEKMFHTKGEAVFTLYPDKAYLEIKGKLYNGTDRVQTFLWWANPAVSVNDYTRSIFPPDVTYVFDHGKRDVSKFPISDSVYYKVNYAPGTDISRYRNIPVPTSYMAGHSDFDFIGNYDDSKEAGLLHVADHHISPGKKQWTWGNGDFGRAWDRNLTDENGPYIELMTGVFTDNQPDFTFLKPYEEKTFTQYFMPYKAVGAVKNANREYALNVERNEETVSLIVYSSVNHSKSDLIRVSFKGKAVYENALTLNAAEAFKTSIEGIGTDDIKAEIIRDGKVILAYTPVINDEKMTAKPAKAMLPPREIESNEELYLDGMHLEQYRHATFNPADYYLEGLRRDPSDIRINNAYGRLLFKNGYFKESIGYFNAAIKRSTFRNPNPYDCEPYFNLGLALEMTGDYDRAYDAFYKAVWDENFRAKGFYKLACLELRKGNLNEALEFLDASLEKGLNNLNARTLKACTLRLLGRGNEAKEFVKDSLKRDMLDFGALYEDAVNTGDFDKFDAAMRKDPANFIELSLCYIFAGLYTEAANILKMAPSGNPLVSYYLYYCTDDEAYLKEGEGASSLYCFPNRTEDINVLKKAVNAGGKMAAYYLGCLFYDKGNFKEAISLWESAKKQISLPTVYRNLSIAYYNKCHDIEKAIACMEKAFSMDRTDARVFFELDLLYKITDRTLEERLSNMTENLALMDKTDPLFTEYISVLNGVGKYELAYELCMSHKFHPWEGGEGKITGEYKKALIGLAKKEKDDEKAVKLLKKALSFPENLSEGKLIGALDNDIYYYLGERSLEPEKTEYFKLSARGDFNLSSARYYNDQPPEMMYFKALAMDKLSEHTESVNDFKAMIEYGENHMNDEIIPDFFAVSLPDFLVFDADLNKNNKKHCEKMIALGKEGLKIIGGRDADN